MATLSTHVLDTSAGRPAAGIAVQLFGADGTRLGDGVTDTDGRVGALGPALRPGDYVLRFETGAYQPGGFYPEVVVTFRVGGDDHYHVPLLLSPFGYSTYRGS